MRSISPRSPASRCGNLLALALSLAALGTTLDPCSVARATGAYQPLPAHFIGSGGPINANNDWSLVPGILGYRGVGLTASQGIDPQTITGDDSSGSPFVVANQKDPAVPYQGVAEFEHGTWLPAVPTAVLALRADSQNLSDGFAPYLVYCLNASAFRSLRVSYTLIDIDTTATSGNAVEPVALQYRAAASGAWTNLPDGFVADATDPPSSPRKLSHVSVALPSALDNDAAFQLRIIASNALGKDEWVAIDSVSVTGVGLALAQVSPDTLRMTGNDAAREFVIRDAAPAGYDALHWQAGIEAAAWASLPVDSGTVLPADSATVSVMIDASGLAAGSYDGRVHVTTSDPNHPSLAVALQLVVGPDIATSPASLSFVVGQNSSGDQPFTITNLDHSSAVTLDWSASDVQTAAPPGDCPWLTESPALGSVAAAGSQDVTVTANTAGLAIGTLSCALRIQSNDPDRALVSVPVSLLVTGPRISVVPSSLSISVADSLPYAIRTSGFDIRNTGIQTALNWSIASQDAAAGPASNARHEVRLAATCPWLQVSPAEGSTAAGGHTTVTVTADGSGMPAGDDTCQVVVSSDDLATSTVVVPVYLHVVDALAAPDDARAVRFHLDPVRPNPARAESRVGFALPRSERVSVEVFDVQGHLATRLARGEFAAGVHSIPFDTRRLASGVYLVRMQAGPFTAVRRAVVAR